MVSDYIHKRRTFGSLLFWSMRCVGVGVGVINLGRAISKQFEIHYSAVRIIVYKSRQFKTVDSLPRSGNPGKFSPKADCLMLKYVYIKKKTKSCIMWITGLCNHINCLFMTEQLKKKDYTMTLSEGWLGKSPFSPKSGWRSNSAYHHMPGRGACFDSGNLQSLTQWWTALHT